MPSRHAAHVFNRLLNGTVPDRGLDEIAVGVEKHRKELQRMLDDAQRGSGDVKFLRGGYGCGKTFMATLAVQDAQDAKFVTSFVVVSDNDLHFQKFDELYRKVVGALSTPACPQGALGDILDRWIGSLEEGLIELGVSEDDPDFDKKVLAKLDEQLAGLTQGRAPVDMTRAVHGIFNLKQQGKLQEASALISWLSGSENVSASVKNLAQLKGDISSGDALAYLRGILEIIKSAGYSGLMIVIDEAETILRMRSEARQKSLNAIRQIVDAAKDFPGLLWIFTGTPTFFDDRRGVKGLEPLYDRIKFESFGGVASLRQPQLDLKPFDRDRLVKVALRVRSLHPDLTPEEAETRISRTFIEQLADKVTEGFRGDVGVVPRQFLRTFTNIVDIVATDPEQDPFKLLGFTPKDLSPEEKAAIEGRSLEAPAEDEFAGGAIDM
ncbi:MAG TPA: BREX system ATP-binding protein BrxD [Polyangiaceae bacterium]|nr:BREX system ATP-binding protein BrxD [Polyangiaceae bacterium]